MSIRVKKRKRGRGRSFLLNRQREKTDRRPNRNGRRMKKRNNRMPSHIFEGKKKQEEKRGKVFFRGEDYGERRVSQIIVIKRERGEEKGERLNWNRGEKEGPGRFLPETGRERQPAKTKLDLGGKKTTGYGLRTKMGSKEKGPPNLTSAPTWGKASREKKDDILFSSSWGRGRRYTSYA